jgi:hypothetical protein
VETGEPIFLVVGIAAGAYLLIFNHAFARRLFEVHEKYGYTIPMLRVLSVLIGAYLLIFCGSRMAYLALS